MTETFKEFAATYEEFKKRLPKHPLVEELRSRISRGRFPSDEWLKSRTKSMRDLMAPIWARSQSAESQNPHDDYLDVA